MQFTASDGMIPVHHRLWVIVVHIDVARGTVLEKNMLKFQNLKFHILHFIGGADQSFDTSGKHRNIA